MLALNKIDSQCYERYPSAIRWISFLRDFSAAKDIIRTGKNKKVRELMKPYLDYNIRAFCFYSIALLPSLITKKVIQVLYKNRF